MMQLKRVYEAPSETDGFRVLIDRLWPRGVSKEQAAVDLWLKDIAPSPELRIWFDHDPVKFEEFSERYQEELAHNAAISELQKLLAGHKTVTLLYGAKDPSINHAVVLEQFLERQK